MKITKYFHSCLTVEHDGMRILFDPGIYTYQNRILDVTSFANLDYILITHEHPDHLHIPFLKKLVSQFPKVKIISTPSVQSILGKENISVSTESDEYVTIEDAPHELIFGQSPQNYAITVFNTLTHPGDSFHFTKTMGILALTVQAPWGSYAAALEKAKEVKPNIVIPIHDWHLRDEARKQLYQRAQDYLKSFGIRFISIETNQPIKV